MLLVVFVAGFALAQGAADKRRSGYQDMGEALQKMQDDDTANPGMLFVQLGEQLWSKPAGAANKACAECHTGGSMKSVAARYPAIPKDADKPVDLERRINLCRTANQQAEPLAPESRRAAVARSLCRVPVARPADRAAVRSAPWSLSRAGRRDLSASPGPAQPQLRDLP